MEKFLQNNDPYHPATKGIEINTISLFLYLSSGHQHIVKGTIHNKQYKSRDQV